MNKEAGRKLIAERVEDFEKNKPLIMKKSYGETNIRTNYIDVMFEALGWNIRNKYEVDREFSQRDKSTAGGTKKVDYAFKINGKLKFFIEAKEASVDLENDKSAIFQAKRYAYSSNGKAPIVILTDFEEFRVFNVIKAPLMDNTDRELLKTHTMRYTDYLEKWDLLWDTFSKEAVGNGSLDKLRGKIDKNTKTMDVDFLEQITSWREILAKNIAIRNENLNVDEINEAVQRILDRLVFIRNLEDREIEPENTLLDKTKKSENIYKSLIPIFNSLNTTYNGLLFKKHFSEEINVDDKTIHDIIRQMCYPVSPFQFDVIEPEILGRIYEKFLGSKIRLTDSHRAKIEEKIEVRKAGGVYYTPEYIVEYIVQNTVGKKIEGLTPEEIKKIKIVDPACGSGSFLIGAYSYLLDYHQKWYTENQKDKTYQADWYKTNDGEIKVRLDKRGDILRNNIFGVDIDKEATEVAIMSLYLKMLDDGFDKGERDLFFVKGSVLPDMVENIKCGNSLIGSDYFDGNLNFTDNEYKDIKPFDWSKEFQEIFSNGGFDSVIGNPPYIHQRDEYVQSNEIDYYKNNYLSSNFRQNTYTLFVEKGLSLLNKNGFFSYIMPNYFLSTDNDLIFRDFLFNKNQVLSVLDVKNVFADATVYCVIPIVKPGNNSNEISFFEKSSNIETLDKNISTPKIFKPSKENDYKLIFLEKKTHCVPLGEYCKTYMGVVPYRKGYGEPPQNEKIVTNKVYNLHKPEKNNDLPYYTASDVGFFYNKENVGYIRYGKNLAEPRSLTVFSDKRIIFQRIISLNPFRLKTTIFNDTCIVNSDLITLKPVSEEYNKYIEVIAAIVSSKIFGYMLSENNINLKRDVYPKINMKTLLSIDIPVLTEIKDTTCDNLTSIVTQIIDSNKKLNNAVSEADKELYSKKINMLEEKKESIIYQLYKLTDEEIKNIESQ